MNLNRRGFVGGLAASLAVPFSPLASRLSPLLAQTRERRAAQVGSYLAPEALKREAEYDAAVAKLSGNENPWGPLDSAMEAMNAHWKYSNRYNYPDAGIVEAVAAHHGVTPQHILMGAGSSEILDVVSATFLERGNKKVLGVEPTYANVFQYATRIKSDAIKLPLNKDYTQSIPAFIDAAKRHAREIGFVYLCNPNNPTGIIVTRREVQQLLDGIPADLPVLLDEAYFHYVRNPEYGTGVPHVLEGRRVIIARTFSKVLGIAAMRVGYAIAPPDLIERMRPQTITNSVNALAKWGAVAGLKDTAGQQKVVNETLRIRDKTIADVKALGYEVVPTEANYFMIGIRRDVQPVIDDFRKRGVLVGRPFPPMTRHLRVSVGNDEEMAHFLTAFKAIFPAGKSSTGD
jgi:histidinol-phosphate aminotransferase